MILNIQYFGGLYLLLEKDYDHILIKKGFFDKLLTYKDIVLDFEELQTTELGSHYKVLFFFNDRYFNLIVRPITYNYVVTLKQTLIKNGDEFLEHSFDGLASKIKYGFNKITKEYRFDGKYDNNDFKRLSYSLRDDNKTYDYKSKRYSIARITEINGVTTPFLELKIKLNGQLFSNLVNFNILKERIAFLKKFNYSDFLFNAPLNEEERLFIRDFVKSNIKEENLVALRVDQSNDKA